MYNVSSEIRNKLKLDNATSFCRVQDWSAVPQKKFERVLYFMKDEDNEEEVLNKLSSLCLPSGLILCCNVPETNKRLSNGHIVENKEVFKELMAKEGNERFWFFSAKREHFFDFLLEVNR